MENTNRPSNATNEPANVVLPQKSYSSKEHRVRLHPLYTMKMLDQYSLSPNEEFLAPLAKSHYDDENLDDIIDPVLKEQMDPESFKIFSKTASECLKDQRAQRPTIDQILLNLEKALAFQLARENPVPPPIVASEVERTSSDRLKAGYLERLRIPLTDIMLATDNFTKRYIGAGGYGRVYRAQLDLLIEEKKGEYIKKQTTVAIKCIKNNKHGEEGFVAEIELLTRCKHENIVSLLGFCDEGEDLILVYEHAPNRSLDDYLVNDNLTNLAWAQRLKTSIDIARGLNYLHTEVEDKRIIIHRDIKSGNILLGKNWVAKIADFGLSKFHQQKETHYSKNVAGTNYYMCPEYQKKGKLKSAIDIYSFGVVLFEILSGKLAYDSIYTKESENGIAHVARRRSKDKTLNMMVDPKIMEEVDELATTLSKGPNQESLETFLAIATQCVAEDQEVRPTAQKVLEELEKALSFQENNKNNLQMSFKEIKLATKDFHRNNRIGGGGFGRVYTGEVTRGNEPITIVAKRLDSRQGQGEQHFLMELEILFEYKHENIIGLEGYCNEKDEKIIIYEHASKISLDRHLGDQDLTWMKRLSICIDIARGLGFLHEGALTKEMVIHRDIKCANILLNDDWKAKISDFGLSVITPLHQKVVTNLVGTVSYLDPDSEITGFFTEKSDIYSLGVVLFEVLHGQLLVPNTKDYDKQLVSMKLEHVHDEGKFNSIVFEDIKAQIAQESLSTFRLIVRQCLDNDGENRPTAKEVLQQLKKALEFQEEYEIWESKLPKDYKEILQMSKSTEIDSTKKKKDLYNIFSKGILLQEGKVWFSLGSNGERFEMIPARECANINSSPHKWQFFAESRFVEVVEMFDLTNLMINIKTSTQLLSPGVHYGVYLVFKFCDSRKYSSKPTYVNLKFKHMSETFHAYFATPRDDKWMMIELFRASNYKDDFEFLLQRFSRYYCGDGAIYVEGIEFRTIDNAKLETAQKLTEVEQLLNPNLNINHAQQSPTNSEDIIERSANYDDREKLVWLSEVNGKKQLMLSAKKVLYDISKVELFTVKPSPKSRFHEVIELLPQPLFLINYTIESQMLSSETEYVGYLVFKISENCHGLHCPVKLRDLHQQNKDAEHLYFISPSPWNLHDFTRVPKQREDGWMEVDVGKFNSNQELKAGHLPVNLKFISYEEPMSGLIVGGLEFRPA